MAYLDWIALCIIVEWGTSLSIQSSSLVESKLFGSKRKDQVSTRVLAAMKNVDNCTDEGVNVGHGLMILQIGATVEYEWGLSMYEAVRNHNTNIHLDYIHRSRPDISLDLERFHILPTTSPRALTTSVIFSSTLCCPSFFSMFLWRFSYLISLSLSQSAPALQNRQRLPPPPMWAK